MRLFRGNETEVPDAPPSDQDVVERPGRRRLSVERGSGDSNESCRSSLMRGVG